jgi:hypothetical protein
MPRQNRDQMFCRASQMEAILVAIEIVFIVALIICAIKLLPRR